MSFIGIKLTDPAFEFAALATKLREFRRGDGTSTYKVLAEFIAIDETSPRLFELIGYVGSRAVSLMEFIGPLEDEFLDLETKKEMIAVVHNISQVISPANMFGNWHQVQSAHLISQQIIALRQFSQTARRYRPLRLVTDEERTEIVAQIDEALSEAKEVEGIPEWALGPLREGLRRLKTMIQHFDFFGHEAVLDHLIRVHGEATAASTSLTEQGIEVGGKLWRTARVVATAVGIFAAPVTAYEGYQGYRGYIHQIIKSPPALLAAPIKRLTGPKNGSKPALPPIASQTDT